MQKRSRKPAKKAAATFSSRQASIEQFRVAQQATPADLARRIQDLGIESPLGTTPSRQIGRTTNPGVIVQTNPNEAYDTPASLEEIKLRHTRLVESHSRYVAEIANFEKVSPGNNEFMMAAAKLANVTIDVIESRAAFLMQCIRT